VSLFGEEHRVYVAVIVEDEHPFSYTQAADARVARRLHFVENETEEKKPYHS
jgi:hypothetical protein